MSRGKLAGLPQGPAGLKCRSAPPCKVHEVQEVGPPCQVCVCSTMVRQAGLALSLLPTQAAQRRGGGGESLTGLPHRSVVLAQLRVLLPDLEGREAGLLALHEVRVGGAKCMRL